MAGPRGGGQLEVVKGREESFEEGEEDGKWLGVRRRSSNFVWLLHFGHSRENCGLREPKITFFIAFWSVVFVKSPGRGGCDGKEVNGGR